MTHIIFVYMPTGYGRLDRGFGGLQPPPPWQNNGGVLISKTPPAI